MIYILTEYVIRYKAKKKIVPHTKFDYFNKGTKK